MRTRDERGQVMVLVIGLTLVAFAVAGLAVDGTRAFIARKSLQDHADAAALAAAGEVDRDIYYSSGGRTVELDAATARATVRRFLGGRVPVTAAVVADRNAVRVSLKARIPTTLLGLAGIGGIPIAVEARARPVPGAGNP